MRAPDLTSVRAAFDALAAEAPPNVSIAKARESLEDALDQVRGSFAIVENVIRAAERKAASNEAATRAKLAAEKAAKAEADRRELLKILRAELRKKQLMAALPAKTEP